MKVITINPLQKAIKAKITIPGSKSFTNRAIFLAAMTKGVVKIMNPLKSDDTKAMIGCLKKLGIKIIEKEKSLEVINDISSIKNHTFDLDANESGTTMRFILALSTIIPGVKTLYGKEELNKRPIGDLVEALKFLDAKIEYLGKKGYPPVKVLSSKLNSGTIKIQGSISSQYISAFLMIAPLIGGIKIEILGKQISTPYIDMTIDTMEKFGVKIINKEYKAYSIAPQKYIAKQYLVEGDLSSAGYFLAIAVLTKSTIILKNINPNSKQADIRFVRILKDMGNKIVYEKNQITIFGEKIQPVTLDMTDCPDQVQTLAVLASFAKGVTKISGISSLRIKETDRVFALKQELKKMGIRISSTENLLTIHGGNPKAAIIETHGDHRMAMSFAVAAAKLSGMEITNPQVVNKTFPDFWKKLNSLGMKIKILTRSDKRNIVLIGMRRSGKTTVAKLLANKLNRQYLELDKLIAEKVKLTIPEIVSKYGWDFFRDKESEIAKDVSLESNKIISTGGGVILRQENINALKKKGICILLGASVETLIKRIGDYSNLPSLTNKKTPKEELELVLKQRKHLYAKAADRIIETDNLTPTEVVDKIISKIGERV